MNQINKKIEWFTHKKQKKNIMWNKKYKRNMLPHRTSTNLTNFDLFLMQSHQVIHNHMK